MQLRLVLTVQPSEGPMRFFSADTQAAHAPRVGDSLAVARWRDTSPDSSPITAEVTAVRWNDLDFQAATVFLRGTEAAIDLATLTGGCARWVDETHRRP